jgi:hypothetical protein
VTSILEGKTRSDTLSHCKFALLRLKVESLGGHWHSHSQILFILVEAPHFLCRAVGIKKKNIAASSRACKSGWLGIQRKAQRLEDMQMWGPESVEEE